MTRYQLFKHGAKQHPGNIFYVVITIMMYLAAFMNEDVLSGIIGASIFEVLLIIMYISTSISVGKANKENKQ